ncbi:MAG: hypothetical protein WCL21_16735, partial [Mariniphaga sp.]
ITCTGANGPTVSTPASTVIYTCPVVAVSAGTYVPVFTYHGDTNYSATAPTSGFTTTVNKVTPNVLVTVGATPLLGGTMDFTATVTGPSAGVAPSATGSWAITGVTGVTTCTTLGGPIPASNVSTYHCSVLATRAGNYVAKFTFTGDNDYNAVGAVSSPAVPVLVATPTVVLTSTGTPTLGGTITFTATATGSANAVAPAGVMTFTVSQTTTLGVTSPVSCTPQSGPTSLLNVSTWTCLISAPVAGSYSATANLAAESAPANYGASVAGTPLVVPLPAQAPTITLTASASPTVGQPVTLIATVTGISGATQPSGSVSWLIKQGVSTITNSCTTSTPTTRSSNVSTYNCTFTPSIIGVYTISATIAADVNYLTATSSNLLINLASLTPSINVFSSGTPAALGSTITFTAIVTGASPNAPTGTMTWSVSGTGGAKVCGGGSGPVTPNGSFASTYTCQVATPVVGTYVATATFNGDLNYASLAPSAPVTVTVNQATPSISVVATPATPVLGGNITYTATVSGVVGATPPAGSITWLINGATATCPVVGPTAGSPIYQTTFSCTIPALSAITYGATATYNGDTNFTALPATSAVNVNISKVTPTAVLTSSGPGTINSTFIFSAAVTGVTGVPPTGTNAAGLWTVGGTSGVPSCTTTPVFTASGAVTTYLCTIDTGTHYGSYVVTFNYPGDGNYNPLVSNTVTVGIAHNSPTISAISYGALTLGGTTTLSVTVDGTVALLTPSSAMTWAVTAPISGNPISCTTSGATLDSPAIHLTTYTCTIPTATAGTYLATATFPGDANFNSIISATSQIAVAKVPPTLLVTGVQSSSTSGQIITYTGTVNGVSGSLAPTGAPTWTVTGPGSANTCASTTGPVTNGVNSIYTCVVPAALAGTYTARISVALDSNYNAAGPSTPIFSIVISQVTPLVTVATSTPTANVGDTITFTATVAGTVGGAAPTGSGTWSIIGVNGITCTGATGPNISTPVSSVTYICPVIAKYAGTYVPVFTYNGDTNYSATAPTSGFTTSVAKVAPSSVIVTSGSTPALGGTITFTATVTGPANGAAPSSTGSWAITGVTGVTTCSTTTGPTPTNNVSVYHCSVVATRAGSYVAAFTFTGDNDYNAVGAVSSPAVPVAVATPTVALTSTGTPTLGGTLTFTATATGSANAVAPAGAMTFVFTGSVGTPSCNTVTGPVSTLNVSTYTCTVLTPLAGNYAVVANLAAETAPTNYGAAATSNQVIINLPLQTPLITVSGSSNPSPGTPMTLTTTITGIASATAQPSGQVSWLIKDHLGATISNGCNTSTPFSRSSNVATYTCLFTPPLNGIYTITSTIAADSNYITVTSSALLVSVASLTPSISLTSSPLTSTSLGSTITYTATVTGIASNPAPGGTVTWTISGTGGATSCSSQGVPTSSGPISTNFTCQVATPVVGTYIATATYDGDSNYNSLAPSTAVTVNVTKATPTIGVVVTPTSPVLGGTITYTATVSGVVGATAPAGSILWTINGTTSTCPISGLLGPTAVIGSPEKVTFTCTISALAAITYITTATYSGDTNYTPLAAFPAGNITIAKVTPTVVLTSSGPGTINSTFIFSAAVTGVTGVPPTGTNAAGLWTVGGTSGVPSCTTTPAFTSSGAVTTYLCTIDTGTHYGSYVVTFNYPGDGNYFPVVSNTATVGIAHNSPTISAVSYGALTLGGTTTLSVVVDGTTAGLTPGGSMTWTATAPSGGTLTCSTPTVTPNSPATNKTTYTCTIPTVTAGTYLASATFPGDANFSSVASGTSQIVVASATPTLAVTGVQSSTTSGQIITYTGTVTGVTGSLAPTGSLTWTVTGPGSANACASTTGAVTNGVNSIYTCVVPAALAGTYTARISVASDSNYLAAGPSTPILTIVISQITPLVTVATSTPTANLGDTFTFTATVAGTVGGAAPTGSGTWSIIGVTGITCTGATGPTVSTPASTVTYSCPIVATSAGTYVPVFTYHGDANYSATAPTSGFTTTVSKATPSVSVTSGATPVLGGTIDFTATVTGAIHGVAPSATSSWAITGVTGVTSCSSITGPTQVSNVSTYHCSVVAAHAGSYVAVFTFTGDNDYNAVGAISSPTVSVAVATPTVVLSSSGTPTLGGTLTFTATATGSANADAPTGVMTFVFTGSVGSPTCNTSTGPVSVGNVSTYTCTVLTPFAGNYIATADLAAEITPADYGAALASNQITVNLPLQTPLISVSASGSPTVNHPVTLITTVTGVYGAVQPSGQVSWVIKNSLGATIANGCSTSTPNNFSSNIANYVCTFTPAVIGTYTITSSIVADTNYLGVTSAALPINLATQVPSISVQSSPISTTTLGTPITFLATINGVLGNGAPTGGVTWIISGTGGATTCAPSGPTTGSLNEIYTCQVATPVVGTYIATATFNGDAIYSSLAPSPAVTVNVTQGTPTIAITTSPASPTLGGTITYTATVTGVATATPPAGSITWTINGTVSTCPTQGPQGPITGSPVYKTIFSCTIPATSAIVYNATATYSGDTNFTPLAAFSAPTVTILKITPTAVLSSSGLGTINSTFTFSAAVTGVSGVAQTNSNLAANWNVSGSSGIVSCTTNPAPTTSGATTTYLCTIDTGAHYGSYIVSYSYPGDNNYNPITSNIVTVGIAHNTPTITAITNSGTTLGGTTVLSVTVNGVSPLTPGGTMAWAITAPVTGNPITCATPTVTPNILTYQTTYTCTIPTVTAGTYVASANFPGDANYNAIASASANIVVSQVTPTPSVTGVQSSTTSGQIITYTGTITGVSGSLAPTGAPTWAVTGPGSANTCSSTTGPVTNGVSSIYTCVVPATLAGTYTARISTAFDNNYFASGLSSTFSITIAQVTPLVTVTTSTPTANLGDIFTFSATVAGTTGGAAPTGTGSWLITGVSGITCNTPIATPVATLSSTKYTCNVTASVAGIYVPVFTYGGDSNYYNVAPTSGASTLVTGVVPTITISNPASATLGSSFTFTATVAGP